MNPLVAAAIQVAPEAIALVRAELQRRAPGAQPPSDVDAMLALQQAFIASMSKDEAWLAAHPPTQPG